MKKYVLGLGVVAMMMGMSQPASAAGKWWYCYDFGEDYSDQNKRELIIFYSTIFYMDNRHRPYSSDFNNTIQHKKFLSKVYRCNHYRTKKDAKHARDKRVKDEVNRSIKVRYTHFDG